MASSTIQQKQTLNPFGRIIVGRNGTSSAYAAADSCSPSQTGNAVVSEKASKPGRSFFAVLLWALSAQIA